VPPCSVIVRLLQCHRPRPPSGRAGITPLGISSYSLPCTLSHRKSPRFRGHQQVTAGHQRSRLIRRSAISRNPSRSNTALPSAEKTTPRLPPAFLRPHPALTKTIIPASSSRPLRVSPPPVRPPPVRGRASLMTPNSPSIRATTRADHPYRCHPAPAAPVQPTRRWCSRWDLPRRRRAVWYGHVPAGAACAFAKAVRYCRRSTLTGVASPACSEALTSERFS
jgi:hypothetical protein